MKGWALLGESSKVNQVGGRSAREMLQWRMVAAARLARSSPPEKACSSRVGRAYGCMEKGSSSKVNLASHRHPAPRSCTLHLVRDGWEGCVAQEAAALNEGGGMVRWVGGRAASECASVL